MVFMVVAINSDYRRNNSSRFFELWTQTVFCGWRECNLYVYLRYIVMVTHASPHEIYAGHSGTGTYFF